MRSLLTTGIVLLGLAACSSRDERRLTTEEMQRLVEVNDMSSRWGMFRLLPPPPPPHRP